MNDKAKYAIRIVLGGYLAFLGIRLFKMAVIEGTGNTTLGMFLGPIFIIVGVVYLINSVKKVLAIRKGEVYGTPETEEETDVVEEAELIEENKEKAETEEVEVSGITEEKED